MIFRQVRLNPPRIIGEKSVSFYSETECSIRYFSAKSAKISVLLFFLKGTLNSSIYLVCNLRSKILPIIKKWRMVHSDLTEALTSKIQRDFIKMNTIFFDIQPYVFKILNFSSN